jgi:hypothetical protein
MSKVSALVYALRKTHHVKDFLKFCKHPRCSGLPPHLASQKKGGGKEKKKTPRY